MGETGCCPSLNKKEWDKKTHKWKNKPFYKTSYLSLFHVPLNIGDIVTKAMNVLEKRKLVKPPTIMLSKEDGMFSSTMLIEMARETSDLPLEKLNGEFVSMLFEGDYKDAGMWVKQMLDYVKSKGKETTQLYHWYVTCPKCAKEYGKNQTVIFAQLK